MDWENKKKLDVSGIQIFLGDLKLRPERFTEQDYLELI
jgi:hypothetical protein